MISMEVRKRVLAKLDLLIDNKVASDEEMTLRRVLDLKNSDRYVEDFLNDNTDFRVMISKMN